MAYPPFPLQTGFVSLEAFPLLFVLAGFGLSFAGAIVPDVHFVIPDVVLLVAGLAGLFIALLAGPIILGLLVLVFGALTFCGCWELDIYGRKGEGKASSSDALTGKIGRVTEHATPTSGEVKFDEGSFNPYYAAQSIHGESEAGAEVIIVDPGGNSVVIAEGVGPGEDETDRELIRERAR